MNYELFDENKNSRKNFLNTFRKWVFSEDHIVTEEDKDMRYWANLFIDDLLDQVQHLHLENAGLRTQIKTLVEKSDNPFYKRNRDA